MKRKTVLLWILTLSYTMLIFSFSMMTGSDSGGLSSRIAAFVMPFFSRLGLDFEAVHHLIRKLAHFSEYYILALFVKAASENTFRGKGVILCIMLYGIIAPCIDETIQLFVPGRAGALTDVLIDMSGYFASWATASLLKRNQ
jgi:VanZ family protein